VLAEVDIYRPKRKEITGDYIELSGLCGMGGGGGGGKKYGVWWGKWEGRGQF